VQTKIFVPRLAKLLDGGISITAFYGNQAGVLNVNGIKIYPTFRDPYGQDVIGAHAVWDQADAVISLIDIWIMRPENIPVPWFPWFPVDHEPMPTNVLEKARQATKCITMSKFGKRMAEMAGLDTWYVPHGIDTEVFKPLDREESRKHLEWDQDKFIVGMVAANKGNPSRKAFYEQIAAFAALHSAHPDTMLYLHTDMGVNGGDVVDLPKFIRRMGLKIGTDVKFCDPYMNGLGFPDEYMVDVYNAMDVLTNVSLGEGFGIPILEAQACGTPVIVGDWTSMSELCFAGWKVDKAEALPVYHDFFDAFQFQATTAAIYDRMLQAYTAKDDYELRNQARRGALPYDVDAITRKYWKPILKEMREIIGEAK
jgi:glycosyltransferase involved in cell wall biosynthesis